MMMMIFAFLYFGLLLEGFAFYIEMETYPIFDFYSLHVFLFDKSYMLIKYNFKCSIPFDQLVFESSRYLYNFGLIQKQKLRMTL